MALPRLGPPWRKRGKPLDWRYMNEIIERPSQALAHTARTCYHYRRLHRSFERRVSVGNFRLTGDRNALKDVALANWPVRPYLRPCRITNEEIVRKPRHGP